MADAGGVVVQVPVDPLHKASALSSVPLPTTQHEADLYATLKKLQRDLEFLTLQEVRSIHLISTLLASQGTNDCGIGIHQRRTEEFKARIRTSPGRSKKNTIRPARHRPISRTHRSKYRNRRIYNGIQLRRPHPFHPGQRTSQAVFERRSSPTFQRPRRHFTPRSRLLDCHVGRT